MKSPIDWLRSIKYAITVRIAYTPAMRRMSRTTRVRRDEQSEIGVLTMAFHTIEKGFVMPDFRLGFGRKRLAEWLPKCESYLDRYGTGNVQIRHIAETLSEYRECHRQAGYELDSDIAGGIERILARFPDIAAPASIQIDTTAKDYFSHCGADFAEFSASRHSCRNFTDEPVSAETLRQAIALAQNAPSACNRQPARVYIVKERGLIDAVFSHHGGNRGFGHKVDKLLVITGYLPCYSIREKDCVHTDCGIFTLNLAYSLHYHRIGNVILNWSVPESDDREVRKLLDIPYDEVICTLIACGNVPERFKVCRSAKKDTDAIIRQR